MHVEARGQPGIKFLRSCPPFLLEAESLTDLELTGSVDWPVVLGPAVLPPQHWVYDGMPSCYPTPHCQLPLTVWVMTIEHRILIL